MAWNIIMMTKTGTAKICKYEYLGFTRANNPEYLPAYAILKNLKIVKDIFILPSAYMVLVSDLNCKMEWIANIEDKSGTVVSGLTYS